jgi:hypothetical protein
VISDLSDGADPKKDKSMGLVGVLVGSKHKHKRGC